MDNRTASETITVAALEAMPKVGTAFIGAWEFVRYVSEGQPVWTARKRQNEPEVIHGPADAATIVALCLGRRPAPSQPEDRLSREELRAALHPQR